jgi:DMSO/TMAO reductase YedYZ molybdopterin-dependent catalytic subunit
MAKTIYNMRKAILISIVLGVSLSVAAQKKDALLKVSGEVSTPLELTASDIAAMPHITVVANDRSGNPHHYRGVTMEYVLSKAGVTLGKQLRGENLTKYVLARCADGYEVVYSLAELDSSFVFHVPIIADTADGKPLAEAKGPLRVIVPDEKKPARSCFQLTALTVRYARDEQ